MKKIALRLTCFLTFTVLQFTIFSQPIHAAAKVRFFQNEKLPPAHPLASFHLIYDPQIDVVYLNTQKINVTLEGDRIEATSIARKIRRSYLDGRLQNRGERYVAYLAGKRVKSHHDALSGAEADGKPKVANPAALHVWNERNARSMIPTNNKVAGYKIVAPAPFQEPLSIDWRSYLPHCSLAIRHLYLCE